MTRKSFLLTTMASSVPFAQTLYEQSSATLTAVSDARLPGFKPKSVVVILNGKDISDICYRAELYSDGNVKAYCYRKNAVGTFYFDDETNDVAREVLFGPGELQRGRKI